MNVDSSIFVAGHRGLVGSALVRRLKALGFKNLLLVDRSQLDLADRESVRSFFQKHKPAYVFLAAAKVGGILANDTYPAEFIHENLEIEVNVIHECFRSQVQRLLFLGSSCIYPKECPQPIREDYLLTGPLEETNRAYAVAKIAGIEMCRSYNRQYGTKFLCAMLTNLYGPEDNFDLSNSHVLPALIRKVAEAKQSGIGEVTIWGTGQARREFLFSEDAADACIFLMNLPETEFGRLTRADVHPIINVGCGEDLSIAELAELVCEVLDWHGHRVLDRSKPDGTSRKLLDVSKLRGLGWRPQIGLREGILRSYRDFASRKLPPLSATER